MLRSFPDVLYDRFQCSNRTSSIRTTAVGGAAAVSVAVAAVVADAQNHSKLSTKVSQCFVALFECSNFSIQSVCEEHHCEVVG